MLSTGESGDAHSTIKMSSVCLMNAEPTQWLRLTVDIILSLSNDSQLVACTQYELPSTAPRMESIYICHHSNLHQCISGASYLSLGYTWNCVYCCHTHLVNLTNPRTPELIVAAVTRYLGRGSWPTSNCHEDWLQQSRHWADHLS